MSNYYIVVFRVIDDFVIKILDLNLLRKGLLERLSWMLSLEYELV